MPRKRITPRQLRFEFASNPKSAKHRIEQTPRIRELEEKWYRSKPGELRPASSVRNPDSLMGGYPQLTDKSDIHTHRLNRSTGITSRSSRNDLYRTIESAGGFWRNNIRFKHVVSLDRDGYVAGYFTLQITSAFREWSREQINAGKNPWEIKGMPDESNTPRCLSWKRLLFLKRKGLRVRITPMPGYHFVRGYFVKVRKKN